MKILKRRLNFKCLYWYLGIFSLGFFAFTSFASTEFLENHCSSVLEKQKFYFYFGHLDSRVDELTSAPSIRNSSTFAPNLKQVSSDLMSTTFELIPFKGSFLGPVYHWESLHSVFAGAPLGDVRWPIKILGLEVSEVLGLKVLDFKTIQVPQRHFINSKIKQANSFLASDQQIKIHFSDLPADFKKTLDGSEVTSEEKLFKTTLDCPENEMNIVFSDDGLLTLHDLSYHLLSIVLPGFAIEHAHRIGSTLNDFFEYCEKQFEIQRQSRLPTRYPEYLELKKKIIEKYNQSIDFGNGSFVAGLRNANGGVSWANGYREFTFSGDSPKKWLEKIAAMNGEYFKILFDEFSKQNTNPHYNKSLTPHLDQDQFIHYIENRIAFIREAFLKINE